ncbi:MAG: HD domain-containing protein [Candidatus Aenigmarchaeota archaeon]|nr:HD domain-containing protein [Candidatus Aenigmarchaeota archaeon]
MDNKEIIQKTKDHVKQILERESTGHDWWHIERVWKVAKYLAEKEKANLFIVELAALLHELGDRKLTGLPETTSKPARNFLEKLNIEGTIINHVCEIIDNMSFSKNVDKIQKLSLEGIIVQDADRLDALGAIGIARCFSYGGKKETPLHDPEITPIKHTKESYKKTTTSINHFYEKLLLLKDLMNTKTARQMAENRHKFMEKYLDEFYIEWDGKDLLQK